MKNLILAEMFVFETIYIAAIASVLDNSLSFMRHSWNFITLWASFMSLLCNETLFAVRPYYEIF